jgi:Reverse transcriptase (RNA-dependent DNA polymerase)
MPLLERPVLKRAVENIASRGDTDVFPFPVENIILRDQFDAIIPLLERIAANFDNYINAFPVQSFSTLAPVGYTGFRWATQIEPLWNAYLLALVISLGSGIEKARISPDENKVFSYRYSSDLQSNSIFTLEAWSSFQAETRRLAESYNYVISVDIGDFYSRIYHHRLENSLRMIDEGRMCANQIMALLGKLSNGTSYGLPVGGPAARLLSELLLNRVDHLILTDSVLRNFCRYADDYRFFVNDMQSAYRAIGLLSEKLLRNEGLTLQKSKTRIMTSAEYLALLDPPDPPAGSAAAFLNLHIHYDPYSATAVEDYERLQQQLNEFDVLTLLRAELGKGRIHAALARRLVQALQYMDAVPRQQAVLSLLENIETLAPVIPQVMVAIRSCLDDLGDEFISDVHRRVRDLISTGHYLTQVDLNLAYMIRVLAGHHSIGNEELLINLYQVAHGYGSAPTPNIQRDIMLTLARWNASYWISDQKNYIASAHPWVRRAFIIASYTLGDEGKHWRDSNLSAWPEFDRIVRDWAAQKTQVNGWQVPI